MAFSLPRKIKLTLLLASMIVAWAVVCPGFVCAQEEATTTMFPHSEGSRYYAAGQANIIFQAHGPFHSPYEGANSLLERGEYKTSLVGTLFLGAELTRNPTRHLEVLYDEESAGGRGISEALGLAGFTNLDVVRNPTLGPVPYMARVELHGTWGLSDKMVEAERGPFSLRRRFRSDGLSYAWARWDCRIRSTSTPLGQTVICNS